jgi:hypothetical protein
MRIVGGFYILLALFNTPPVISARFTVKYPDLEAAVVGVALVLLSRDPLLALEVVRGIVDDRYLLTRGYEPIFSVGWIVIHLVIVVTGLLSIRAIRRAQSHAP